MIRNRAAADRRRFEEGEGARRTRPPPPPGCEAIEIGSYELLEERDGHPAQGGKYVRRDDISGTLVGPSKPWCCLSSPEVVCPSVVDKRNWLSGDNYDDTFAITQDGTTLNVSRSDGVGVGWGMALSVLCCTASGREAMDAMAEASAPPPSEKDLLAAAEAAAEAERMRSPDHYEVLRIPADFEPQELKKAYRALSLRLHPDRQGGHTEHFARAAAAHDCLVDTQGCKRRFDEGSDLDGSEHIHGQPSFFAVVERQFFPENHPFEPFGDVFEDVNDDGAGRRNRSRYRQLVRSGGVPAEPPAPPTLADESDSKDEL